MTWKNRYKKLKVGDIIQLIDNGPDKDYPDDPYCYDMEEGMTATITDETHWNTNGWLVARPNQPCRQDKIGLDPINDKYRWKIL
jgi:hypothetical protein